LILFFQHFQELLFLIHERIFLKNDYFSEYYGESIIKPNELAYRQAQGIYQPSECVIVGDDKRLDIDVPKSLGFKTIYVNENGDIKRVEELSP